MKDPNTSQPLRSLTNEEKEWMQIKIKNSALSKKIIVFGGIVFLLVSVLLLQNKYHSLTLSLFVGFGEIVILLLLLLGNKREYDNIKRDSIDKVYKLSGTVFKHRHFGTNDDRTLQVGDVKFDFQYAVDFTFLSSFYDSVKNGDIVIVEYSPRTKHVWKIYNS